ncbi:hypothetical protein WOLCODRAFT_161627 [Wolfiporia cocos MD-104 SS10]|uniref:TERF2-interacting telomeric protein 1 Myb domain-containing protein n=1 Tax=Wolfiporia cocos (strain MD-104) TaxID=742152 RepID=A0A2H3JA76_WOLCO|nr:hypothetical protein WOLCODRAFT_161627 [Wolfiporia cocos MD-104 SS10]
MASPQRRKAFTEGDDHYLVQYLAKYTPDGRYRSGNSIWQVLVENQHKKWPWASNHTWQSWRSHYLYDRSRFDQLVKKLLRAQAARADNDAPTPAPMQHVATLSTSQQREGFTKKEDKALAQYLAEHSSSTVGRMESELYKDLVSDGARWPWASTHPWQSWRKRYKDNMEEFDRYIARKQALRGNRQGLEMPAEAQRETRRQVAEKEEEEEEEGEDGDERQRDGDKGREAEDLAIEGREGEAAEEEPAQAKAAERAGEASKRKRDGRDASEEERRRKRRHLEHSAEDAQDPQRPHAEDASYERGAACGESHANSDRGAAEGDGATKADNETSERQDSDSIATQDRIQKSQPKEPQTQPASDDAHVEEPDDQEKPVDPRLPNDYGSDVFVSERGSNHSSTEEVEGQLASPSPENPHMEEGGQRAQAQDEEEINTAVAGQEVQPDEGIDVDRSPSRNATLPPFAPEDIPQARLYPDISVLTIPMNVDMSLPGIFPITSTPKGSMRPHDEPIVAHIAPSPNVSHNVSNKDGEGRVAQGPTPPTSAAQTPTQSPRLTKDGIVTNTNAEHDTVHTEIVHESLPTTTVHTAQNADSVRDEEAAARPRRVVVKQSQRNAEAGPSAAPSAASKVKLVRRRRVPGYDSDIFASRPPSPAQDAGGPSDLSPVGMPKQLPRLDEGPYNNAFSDAYGRRRTGRPSKPRVSGVRENAGQVSNDEGVANKNQEAAWPPAREKNKKNKGKQKAVAVPPASSVPTQRVPSVKAEPPSTLLLSKKLDAHALTTRRVRDTDEDEDVVHHPFSQFSQNRERPQPDPAVQEEHHPFSQLTQDVGTRRTSDDARISIARAVRQQMLEAAQRDNASLQVPPQVQSTIRQENVLPVTRETTPEQPVAGPSSRTIDADTRNPPFAPYKLLEIPTTPATPRDGESEDGEDGIPSRSVHLESALLDVRGKGKELPASGLRRGHTMGGYPRDDELEGEGGRTARSLLSRKSMPMLPTVRAATASADHSLFAAPHHQDSLHNRSSGLLRRASLPDDMHLSEDDESLVRQLGIETAILTMSENHGFSAEIVRRVWNTTQSLGAAQALKKTDEILLEMRQAAEKVALAQLEALQAQQADQVLRRRQAPARLSRPQDHSVLRFSPTVPEDREPIPSPEYSPPKQSRAGQYVRLMRQGRGPGTLSLELSRAGGISPFRTPQKVDGGAEIAFEERDMTDTGREHTPSPVSDTSHSNEQELAGAQVAPNAARIMLARKLRRPFKAAT